MDARKVLVILSIKDRSIVELGSTASLIRPRRSLKESRFPERTVSRRMVSASPSSVPKR